MKTLGLSALVFLLVFLCGMTAVFWMRSPVKPRQTAPSERRTVPVRDLPPLKLPDEKKNRPGADGWEFSGETAANFVTARAKICSALFHRSWSREKTIPVEESLSPCVLMTFRKADIELVLMLWKIDGDTTGFSYRRERIINPEVETL